MLKKTFGQTKKLLLLPCLLLLGVIIGYRFSSLTNPAFTSLSPEKMHEEIIKERDFAIKKAVERGEYKCCLNPPCTMCYMEANEWNNHKAGTCACDNLIAQGKEPCPQCRSGLCQGEEKSFCEEI